MRLIRTIPKLGGAPELLVFYCRDCDEIEGKDVTEISASVPMLDQTAA
jgi:hypothetical protein